MKKFKKLLLLIVLIPVVFVFCACSKYVVDITKDGSTNIYTVSYSDGTKDNLLVKDGEDGKNVSIEELYEVAQNNGYTGTILEFMKEYLSSTVSAEDKETLATNRALMSTVCVFVEYTVTSSNFWSGETKDLSIGAGAGIIFDINKTTGDAYIMTNYHVVYNTASDRADKMASKIVCFLYGSPIERTKADELDANGYPVVNYNEYAIECEFYGGSMEYDIAVLKVTNSEVIKSSSAMAVTFADSNDIVVGNTAIAVGNPEGYGISCTKGIISVDSEYISMLAADDTTKITTRVIRIDAAINGGNSGGGLFNTKGELIGVVNSKMVDESIDNIAFAIPGNIAQRVAENIVRNATAHNKKAYRGMLGLTLGIKNARVEYNDVTGATKIQDVYIQEISESGVAHKYSAIMVGDTIEKVYINGKVAIENVTNFHQIVDLTWLLNKGDVVGLKLQGKEMVNIIMEEMAFSEVN